MTRRVPRWCPYTGEEYPACDRHTVADAQGDTALQQGGRGQGRSRQGSRRVPPVEPSLQAARQASNDIKRVAELHAREPCGGTSFGTGVELDDVGASALPTHYARSTRQHQCSALPAQCQSSNSAAAPA